MPVGNDDGELDAPPVADADNGTVTLLQFAAFRCHVSTASSLALFMACRLFQEYLCDFWSCIEGCNLRFIRYNQKQLRAESYAGVQVWALVLSCSLLAGELGHDQYGSSLQCGSYSSAGALHCCLLLLAQICLPTSSCICKAVKVALPICRLL